MADPTPDPSAPQNHRLDSWKEIAAHLRRDVRTVQRWERTEGLPVHRLRHTHRGAVHAFTGELDRWWRDRSTLIQRPTDLPTNGYSRLHLPRRASIPPIAVLVLAVAWLSVGRTADIASAAVIGGRLIAKSAEGRELWSVAFPMETGAQMSAVSPTRSVAIGDLDADGHSEVFAAVQVRLATERFSTGRLYAFDSNGRVRWMRTRDDRFRFASGEYGPPWFSSDLAVFRGPGGLRLAWTLTHDLWWPSMLVTLDGEGRTEHRFVHSGWLGRIEPLQDGRHLVVAGVSNQHDDSVLIVLDVARIDGHWAAPGSRYDCVSCPDGAPVRYLRLPRSEGSRGVPLHLLMPGLRSTPRGGFIARVDHDDAAGGSESIYEISDSFELLRASFSDLYWQRHVQLERAGVIHHAASACPERDGPVVLAHVAGNWTRQQPAAHAASEASAAR